MTDQYTVELGFNRPPENIRHMAETARRIAGTRHSNQERYDLIYTADVMKEIATKMEEQDGV